MPDGFYPFAGNNALQSVVLAIEWAGELNSDQLHRFAAIDGISKDLPKVAPLQGVNFMFGPQANPGVPFQVSQMLGWQFSRYNPHGAQIRTLNITSNSATFIVQDYSRWAKVWEDCKRYFAAILPIVCQGDRRLTAAMLQPTDLFIWREERAKFDAKLCLQENEFLPKHFLECSDLWHAHHGFLTQITDDAWAGQQLDNVNVNVMEYNGERAVQLLLTHRIAAKEGATPQTSDQALGCLDQLFGKMHNINKGIVKKLLTKASCEQIGLK